MKKLNGGELKLIAAICMVLDHIGAILLPDGSSMKIVCRLIGRLAFPIFCFLLVEGYLHTKNLKMYLLRLTALAVISEVPFDLAFYGTAFHSEHQNVFFTLLLGLFAMIGIHWIEIKRGEASLLCYVPLAFCMLAASVLKTDYFYLGVMLIGYMYIWRQNRSGQLIAGVITCFIGVLYSVLQIAAPLSFVLISKYNGERGRLLHGHAFYLFYPVHLILLFLVAAIKKNL